MAVSGRRDFQLGVSCYSRGSHLFPPHPGVPLKLFFTAVKAKCLEAHQTFLGDRHTRNAIYSPPSLLLLLSQQPQFISPRNGREAPGDAQASATQSTKPTFICHLFAHWGCELSQTIFPPESCSVLFAVSTWTLPFHSVTKLLHSLKGCNDTS